MKIVIAHNTVDFERESFYIEVKTSDTTETLSFCDGEPEDNSISRNFNDVFSIGNLLELAHEAGRTGEILEVENVEIDSEYTEGLWECGYTENDVKRFLKSVDEGEDLITDDGMINGTFITESPFVKEVVSDEVVGSKKHCVECESIIQILDRFFRISSIGIGKDLDEYVDYSWVEVKPKTITTVVYEDI